MKKGISASLGFATALALVLGMGLPTSAIADDDPCLSSTAILGTAGDDAISGTVGDDIICTLAGNDTIESLAGDDVIIAGDGDDRIISMQGNDYIEAGEGDDFVDAGSGDDEILGNPGDDILWGGFGIDELLGLAGNDTLDGGDGADSVDGGIDRNYCVKDKLDKKAVSCFYDSKAPVLKSVSVAPESRSIDTSASAQWVRVKALIAESGSGVTDVGFTFVNWKSKTLDQFLAMGSLKFPDRLPTSCDSLREISNSPPAKSVNPKSFWCIEKKSSSGVVIEFLIAAPFRLAKGTYNLAGIQLSDGALNESQVNGAKFNVSVRQIAAVPTGIPVLKSFEFLSENKVATQSSNKRISVETTFSTGPVGLGRAEIVFQRDVDLRLGSNQIRFTYNNEDNSYKSCDSKIEKIEIKQTCVLQEDANQTKLIMVTSVPQNSPAGTYRFSSLVIGGKSGNAREFNSEALKDDSKYLPFTKLSVVQTSPSKPTVIDGSIELTQISSIQKRIDTGTGPAVIDVQIGIKRSGTAVSWNLYGNVHAMFCKSGTIRKFKSTVNSEQGQDPIQAGEYCSELLISGKGTKYWWPDMMASNTISTGGAFQLSAGNEETTVQLTIPGNFRQGTIIVGLDQMQVSFAEQKYASVRGNWNAYSFHGSRNAFPSALSCGAYPSCTKYYSVVTNGKQ